MCSNQVKACLAILLALAGCSSSEEARPALWQIDGPRGERGWLFGTIHALPEPVDVRSAALDKAFAEADRLVVEVAALDDDARTAQVFAEMARTPNLPPLDQRITPELLPRLQQVLKTHGLADDRFADLETWAAALTINQALQAEVGSDSANGIDRALLKTRGSKPLAELEGAQAQLAIFDGLPEADQRDLLAAVIRDSGGGRAEVRRIEAAWKNGDMTTIASLARSGLLADPELREALLVNRNRAWTNQIAAILASGEQPFVAVGAMHLAGPDGLPDQLATRGYTVTRLQ